MVTRMEPPLPIVCTRVVFVAFITSFLATGATTNGSTTVTEHGNHLRSSCSWYNDTSGTNNTERELSTNKQTDSRKDNTKKYKGFLPV